MYLILLQFSFLIINSNYKHTHKDYSRFPKKVTVDFFIFSRLTPTRFKRVGLFNKQTSDKIVTVNCIKITLSTIIVIVYVGRNRRSLDATIQLSTSKYV